LALEDALAQVIADQPGVLRQFLHHEVKRVIADRMARGWRVEPADVAGIAAEVSRRMNSGYPTRAAELNAQLVQELDLRLTKLEHFGLCPVAGGWLLQRSLGQATDGGDCLPVLIAAE
jgi:hypothetical protein